MAATQSVEVQIDEDAPVAAKTATLAYYTGDKHHQGQRRFVFTCAGHHTVKGYVESNGSTLRTYKVTISKPRRRTAVYQRNLDFLGLLFFYCKLPDGAYQLDILVDERRPAELPHILLLQWRRATQLLTTTSLSLDGCITVKFQ